MNKKGYTLLELLLTSVLFVGIAMLSTGAFTQILRAPVTSQQNRQAAEQVNGILDEIEADVKSAASAGDPAYKGRVWLYSLAPVKQMNGQVEIWPGNEILIAPVFPTPEIDKAEWRVYCIANSGDDSAPGVQRIVRYAVKVKNADGLGNYAKPIPKVDDPTAVGCKNVSQAMKLFMTGPDPDPISEGPGDITESDIVETSLYPNLAVNSLSFTPIWFKEHTAPEGSKYTGDNLLKPDAIRIEIVAQYNNGIAPDKRNYDQSGSTSRPIVVRRIVNLNMAYEQKAQ